MFQDFFKNLYFQNLKVKAHNLIGQKKLFIHTHPRMWMFFASLMLVAITLLCVKPEFAKGVSESLPIKEANASNAPGTTAETPNWVKTDVLTAQQKEEHSKLDELKQKQRVASWISKRYKIANKASNLFVTTAYKTAFDIGLDPHLILAVMAIESRFNPYAESSMGAQGLMQVMAKVHADKFEDHGGVQYALDPVVNIKVGSRILKEYVRQTGSVERALKTYVKNFLASDNLYKKRYGRDLTPLVGKQFYLFGDTTETYTLGASLEVVRYSDYKQAWNSYSMVKLLPENWYDVGLELCVRVKEDQDKDFITRLKADSEKLYRVGNVFIAEVRSFDDIRRNYQQSQTNSMRSYILGMVFLLLNIFLGLLGTFWFRTQQRRGEIALMKSLGGTDHSVFVRQLVEGLLLLVIATIPAVFINWNLANSELNAWMNGTTIEGGRFIITVLISFILIALMIVVGIWIPARKAMKVQPAEALHNE